MDWSPKWKQAKRSSPASPRRMGLVRQAIARGHFNFGWMRNDPDMASLRDNPEFIALTSGQIAPDEPG